MASPGLRRRRVASTAARRLAGIGIEAQARLEAGGADVGRGAGSDERRVQVGHERRVRERGVRGTIEPGQARHERAERQRADERPGRRPRRARGTSSRGTAAGGLDLQPLRPSPQEGREEEGGDRVCRGGRDHPAGAGTSAGPASSAAAAASDARALVASKLVWPRVIIAESSGGLVTQIEGRDTIGSVDPDVRDDFYTRLAQGDARRLTNHGFDASQVPRDTDIVRHGEKQGHGLAPVAAPRRQDRVGDAPLPDDCRRERRGAVALQRELHDAARDPMRPAIASRSPQTPREPIDAFLVVRPGETPRSAAREQVGDVPGQRRDAGARLRTVGGKGQVADRQHAPALAFHVLERHRQHDRAGPRPGLRRDDRGIEGDELALAQRLFDDRVAELGRCPERRRRLGGQRRVGLRREEDRALPDLREGGEEIEDLPRERLAPTFVDDREVGQRAQRFAEGRRSSAQAAFEQILRAREAPGGNRTRLSKRRR